MTPTSYYTNIYGSPDVLAPNFHTVYFYISKLAPLLEHYAFQASGGGRKLCLKCLANEFYIRSHAVRPASTESFDHVGKCGGISASVPMWLGPPLLRPLTMGEVRGISLLKYMQESSCKICYKAHT